MLAKLQFIESTEQKKRKPHQTPAGCYGDLSNHERDSVAPFPQARLETSEISIQAPGGIRKRMRLILNDMSFSNGGKLQFMDSPKQKAKASPNAGWRLE